jgi:hypothetical protein
MSHYWSDSKFADKIRGIVRPPYGTQDEWDAWEDKAKKKPWRYWLAEDGLDHLQSIVTSPIKLKDAIKIYIINRWKEKTHLLKSSLKPGQYHDLDERILFSVFDELVSMIEKVILPYNSPGMM